MTEFDNSIVFLEHQNNYPNKGDLYKNGNKFFKAIADTYEPEIVALNNEINAKIDLTIADYNAVYDLHEDTLTQHNSIEALNSIPTNLDTQDYRTKLDIFGDGSCVSLNNYRAADTGYFYMEFAVIPDTTGYTSGVTFTVALTSDVTLVYQEVNGVYILYLTFPQVTSRRYILAQSNNKSALNIANLQHLYIERTSTTFGVWLNGHLLNSSAVTLYMANNITPPSQHAFHTTAVKQCRTFNRALTGSEIARLMFQDSNKYTPYPEFASTIIPQYATSGNAIFTNWNTLARGFKKAFIIKPSRVLITGEYISVTEDQINFNVYSSLTVTATASIGLGNVSIQEMPLTLEPIVSYPNTTIELTKSNASSWSSGYSVSAASSYAGYSSATLITEYTKWSIDTTNTTTTNLASPNIVGSNTNPLKIKVNGSVVTLPAGLTYNAKRITPSLNSYTEYPTALTGGSFVDIYHNAGTYWGLYVGSTVTTLVKRIGTVITKYQLPLHDSAFRLGFVSNTELYINSSTLFYKFDSYAFMRALAPTTAPISDSKDILGSGTGKVFYKFTTDLTDINGQYNLTKYGTTVAATTPMRFGSGIMIGAAANYATNTLTWVGATNRVYSFWVKFPSVSDYYNWCFGGTSSKTDSYSSYSWFINATYGKLAIVSGGFDNCEIVANQLYHVVIQVNHNTGAYTIYIDQSLRTSGTNTLFAHTYSTNTYQFFGFTSSQAYNAGRSSYLHYFRIIDLPGAITQQQVDTLFYEGVSSGIFTITEPRSYGNKIISSNGSIYTNNGNNITYNAALSAGSGTNFWVRKSAGMTWEAINLYGKLYSGNTLLATIEDTSISSYGIFKNNVLYVANLKIDKTIEVYSFASNSISVVTQKPGTITTAIKLIGYIINGSLVVDGLTETRDIAVTYDGGITRYHYNDGSSWVPFRGYTGLFPISDNPTAIAGVDLSASYGSIAPSGLVVNLAAVPTEHILDINTGVNVGFALSNSNSAITTDSSYFFPTAATEVFDFTAGTTTKTYGNWVTPTNQSFLHTRLTGAVSNMKSLTINTVRV